MQTNYDLYTDMDRSNMICFILHFYNVFLMYVLKIKTKSLHVSACNLIHEDRNWMSFDWASDRLCNGFYIKDNAISDETFILQ